MSLRGIGKEMRQLGGVLCSVVVVSCSDGQGTGLSVTGPLAAPSVAPQAAATPEPRVIPSPRPRLALTAIDPTVGPVAGGTPLTLIGTGFTEGLRIEVGQGECGSPVVVSSTQMTCTTPPGAVGQVSVKIHAGDEAVVLPNAFTFLDAPQLSSVNPASGYLTGGTSVTLQGANFAPGITVRFGDFFCNEIVLISNAVLQCKTPAVSAVASVPVKVKNPDGREATLNSGFQFLAAPIPPALPGGSESTEVRVSGAVPGEGPITGGTEVQVVGARFASGASVLVGGQPCTGIIVVSSTLIRCTTPSGMRSGGASILVSNTDGSSGLLQAAFQYLASPAVISLSPNHGPIAGGNSLVVKGNGFRSGGQLRLGSVLCGSLDILDGETLRCTVPAGVAGSVSVTFSNSDGSVATLTNAYRFDAPPTVAAASPASGSRAGGTWISISGTGFLAGAAVLVGADPCLNAVIVTSNLIQCVIPPSATTGAREIRVTNPDGQWGSRPSIFSYTEIPASAPLAAVVTSISPLFGPPAGGTALTITGSNFSSGDLVKIGDISCGSVVVQSSTSITCTTPASTVPGRVPVVVVHSNGTPSTIHIDFLYSHPPGLRSVAPAILAGAQTVSVEGANFMAGASATIGGVACGSVSVPHAGLLRCLAPVLAAGSKALVVTNPDGQSVTLANALTYRDAPPTVTSVSPLAGPAAGGTTLTVTGTGFTNSTTVTLEGRPCVSVNVASATSITCTTPALPARLLASLTLTRADGQSAAFAEAFHANPAPAIIAVTPTSGPAAGGTEILVMGSGFLPGSSLSVGGTPCNGTTVQASTLVRCTTPAHAAGSAALALTSPDGQTASLSDAFQFLSAPSLASISPAQGPVGGGNTVLFSGSDFQSGIVLKIGGNLCTSMQRLSSTEAACVVPPGAGLASVAASIHNPDGETSTLAAAYRYTAQKLALSCNPVYGGFGSALAVKPCTESNPETGTLAWSMSGCPGVSIGATTGVLAGNVPASPCTATVTITNAAAGLSESISRSFTIAPYLSLAWNGNPTLDEQCLLRVPGAATLSGGASWSTGTGSAISKAAAATGTATGVSGTLTNFDLGSFTATWSGQSVSPGSTASPLVRNLSLATGAPPYLQANTASTDYLSGNASGLEMKRLGCGSLCDVPTVGQLSVGGETVCALVDDGVRCWGRGDLGQIGNNAQASVTVPTSVHTDGSTNRIASLSGAGFLQVASSRLDNAGIYTSFCGILNDRTLACWGDNSRGQLASGDLLNNSMPRRVPGFSNVVRVEGGYAHFCALRADGTLWCWGANGNGRVGDGSTADRNVPVKVQNLSGVTDFGVGENNACAVSLGRVFCWGDNTNTQLGDGTTTARYEPVLIPGISTAVAVRVGNQFACAVLNDGSVKCWGRNDYGQLGNATTTDSTLPVTVTGNGIAGIVEISASCCTVHARNAAGNVWGWGYGGYGEVGDGMTASRNQATRTIVLGVTIPAAKLVAGREQTCAIADAANNHALYCWGYQNTAGAAFSPLGLNGTSGIATPTAVSGMSNTRDVTINYFASGANTYGFGVAVKRDESLWQWGWNAESNHSGTPFAARFASNVQVSVGQNHACGLLSNGRVRCWGTGAYGQIGDNNQSNRTAPTALASEAIMNAVAVAAGGQHTCALTATGQQKVKCWGQNRYGQLGDATTLMRLVPVDVSLATDVAHLVATGAEHSCALVQSAGNWRTKCWGWNSAGQLGNGNTVSANVPQVVVRADDSTPLADTLLMLAAGREHTCALLSNGTVMCWGSNVFGQLGDGTTSNSTKAVAVTGLTNVVSISAGSSHTCALTREKKIWCWGSNVDGSLGDGTTTHRSTVTLVKESNGNPLAGALAMDAGEHTTCALVEESGNAAGIRCWGSGAMGQMGNGTTLVSNPYPVPVTAPAGTEWTRRRACRSYVVEVP